MDKEAKEKATLEARLTPKSEPDGMDLLHSVPLADGMFEVPIDLTIEPIPPVRVDLMET
jgi:hypothetical protein